MGKRGRILSLALMMGISCSSIAAAQGMPGSLMPGTVGTAGLPAEVLDQQDRKIEQVDVNMPEVFVYGVGLSAKDIYQGEGYLSQERLELVGAKPFSESGTGVCYYVLLDVSGSIPGTYFRNIKQGIQNLQDQLGEKDRLVLCTFGEEVVLAADGAQTSGELSAVLEGLANKDQRTLLFEGISRVALLAEQSRDDGTRKILAVISDGEDIAVGKKLAQEAQDILKEKGLPAYAFCIRDTASANINTFGEFARASGGEIVTFGPQEGSEILCGLADQLENDLQIEYRAATNVVSNKEEQFLLKLADGSTLGRAVMNNRWIPDTSAPVLLASEAAGAQQLCMVFSEPLQGAEVAAKYQLTFEGAPVGITAVSYEDGENPVVNLSLAEPLKNGTYMLGCTNITDVSMEKNPLSGQMELTVDNAPEAEEPPAPPQPPKLPAQPDYTGVLFLIFAAVVVLVIIVVVINNKKKADKKTDEPESRDASGQETILVDKGFQQHVAVAPVPKKSLEVWISGKGTAARKTVWELGSSLIVGRNPICDIRVDDSEMSRQHFCLELQNGSIYITDLDSTNGTSVNGIKIHEKRRLEPGSVVEAGTMKFTIRW